MSCLACGATLGEGAGACPECGQAAAPARGTGRLRRGIAVKWLPAEGGGSSARLGFRPEGLALRVEEGGETLYPYRQVKTRLQAIKGAEPALAFVVPGAGKAILANPGASGLAKALGAAPAGFQRRLRLLMRLHAIRRRPWLALAGVGAIALGALVIGISASGTGDGWIALKARLGDAGAQENLGMRKYYTITSLEEGEEAARWLSKAAERGSVPAQMALASLYEQGRAGKRDMEAAFRWYRQAAEKQEPRALYKVGMAYALGLGTARNRKEAERYLKAGAASHDPDAMLAFEQFRKGRLRAPEQPNVSWMKMPPPPASRQAPPPPPAGAAPAEGLQAPPPPTP